jgi:hypothetical protein
VLSLLVLGTQLHVLEHGEQAESLSQLKRSDLAHLRQPKGWNARDIAAIKRPLTGVRLVKASQQVEQCGFAGTVGANECRDRTAGDFQVGNVHGGETTKLAVNVIHRDDGIHLLNPRLNLSDVKTGGLHNLGNLAFT